MAALARFSGGGPPVVHIVSLVHDAGDPGALIMTFDTDIASWSEDASDLIVTTIGGGTETTEFDATGLRTIHFGFDVPYPAPGNPWAMSILDTIAFVGGATFDAHQSGTVTGT